MKVHLLLFTLITSCSTAFCQTVLHGVVVDAGDRQPVPYVSIGVTSTPNGTVSDAAGAFTLILDAKVKDADTLKFSSIGYEGKAFLVGELKSNMKTGQLSISLIKAVNQLKQVSVLAKKTKVQMLGYQTNSKLLSVGFAANELGSQGGVILSVKHPQTLIENISFLIVQNSFTHLAFRVNLYELTGGKPGKNMLTDNLIIQIADKQTGKVSFDLSKYNLYVDKEVLLTLEWIEAQPVKDTHCAVAAVVFGHTWFRQASQYTWVRKATGLGLSVKTSY